MKLGLDTNVLLRWVTGDDKAQQALAVTVLEEAKSVSVSIHALCEFAWVLDSRYGVSRQDIASAIRLVIGTRNVVVHRPAVEAGLAVLDAGGDFADGVIAFDSRGLGGETFVSFDAKAVKLLSRQGVATHLLSAGSSSTPAAASSSA